MVVMALGSATSNEPLSSREHGIHDYFVADDLSGALDAASAFHRLGHSVVVKLALHANLKISETDILGITTETRNASPADARKRTHEAMARKGRLLYKKIDSTLRGPIAAELVALLEAYPTARVLFAPANPPAGRIVRDGLLLVHGRPLAETEYAQDPIWPARESSLHRLLSEIPPSRIEIPDTETEEDLRLAVARMEATAGDWIAVGSGALAIPVAVARLARRTAPRPRWRSSPSKTLMVCGSAHPENRLQAERLRQERGAPFFVVDHLNPAATIEACIRHLRIHPGATLFAPSVRTTGEESLGRIIEAARQILAAFHVGRLFVTGGETAYALCRALDISALRFLTEIEPGVTLSHATDESGPILVAIKPGGFGNESTWIRVWDTLAGN